MREDLLAAVVVRVEMEVKDVRRSRVLLDGDDSAWRATNSIAVWLSVCRCDPGRVVRGLISSGEVDAAVVRVERVQGDRSTGAKSSKVDFWNDVGEMSSNVRREVSFAAVQISPRRISDGVVREGRAPMQS